MRMLSVYYLNISCDFMGFVEVSLLWLKVRVCDGDGDRKGKKIIIIINIKSMSKKRNTSVNNGNTMFEGN